VSSAFAFHFFVCFGSVYSPHSHTTIIA
jgi:hypothetical protein